MGLASKLAAAQGGAPGGAPGAPAPYGGPGPTGAPAVGNYQQTPQQQSQGGYPGQQSYQAYQPGQQPNPQGQGYGAPPTQQSQQQPNYGGYGAPVQAQGGSFPPQQQQYGGAGQPQFQQQQSSAPPSGGDAASYRQMLERAVQEKGLQRFYPPGSQAIEVVAQHAARAVPQLCQQWKLPLEVGRDLARLGLYDIILFIDDSGSMQFEENGERIDDLKLILQRVSFASTLFDPDGISMRFMNTNLPQGMGDNIRDDAGIQRVMGGVKFSGLTPMGKELKNKVIDGIVLRDARSGQLKKPVLVIAITDGQPAGDDPGPHAVFDTIRYASQEMAKAAGSQSAIAFQFAQVGNDTKAREFLGKLDSDPGVGQLVDCTSNFEQEQHEMMMQNPPVELTPDLWIVKLLLGSIDPSYDSKDEVKSYRPGGGAGAPPSQMPPQQQAYSAPGYAQQSQYNPSYPGGQQYGQQPQYQQPQYQQPQYQQPQYQNQQYQNQQRPPQSGYPAPPNQAGPGYGQQPSYGAPPPPPPRY